MHAPVPLRLVLAALAVATATGAPAIAAEPPACVPLCTVPSTTAAFVPPVTIVRSGGVVSWTADDTTAHTATAEDFCFHVVYGPGRAGSATFRIADGEVLAKTPRGEKTCEATPLPEGGFLLPYVCLYHPAMRATLVVVPAA